MCALACLLPLVAAWAARAYFDDRLDAELRRLSQVEAAASGSPVDAPSADPAVPTWASSRFPPTDIATWSAQRLRAFARLRAAFDPPVAAVLVLPRQEVRIPVFAGVDEVSMTLGAGHLPETAPLDGQGNIALTAHRDGPFRVLRDTAIGDPVVLRLNGRERRFTVIRQSVVGPDRVDVLDSTLATTLTLITCYPFYFVGSAPQRYVLQAELEAPGMTALPGADAARTADLNHRHAPRAFTHQEE
jgi:LPXTG-site transpeptidase (sortase) family protein